jgi:FkbM family methyltransferase
MLIPLDKLVSKYNIKCPGVLHLGANTGQEAADYAKAGFARAIWVEALPEVHAKLSRHVGMYPRSVALLACLSDVDGKPVSFNVASNQGQSSSFLEFGTHSAEHPTVKFERKVEMFTTRADSLLNKHGFKTGPGWFLNVDLQGAELLALKGLGDRLKGFSHAYIEVNEKELYKGCPLVGEIDAYLLKFGFIGREVKMTGAGWGDKYYSKGT